VASRCSRAPCADLADKIFFAVTANTHIPPHAITTTGSRLTLQFASLIVLGAAVYAFKTLSWRACVDDASIPSPLPAEEVATDV